MGELTNGCYGLSANKNEIPELVEKVQLWIFGKNPQITKDQILATMNSIILGLNGDTRGLPRVDNPVFLKLIESSLNGINDLLKENA